MFIIWGFFFNDTNGNVNHQGSCIVKFLPSRCPKRLSHFILYVSKMINSILECFAADLPYHQNLDVATPKLLYVSSQALLQSPSHFPSSCNVNYQDIQN